VCIRGGLAKRFVEKIVRAIELVRILAQPSIFGRKTIFRSSLFPQTHGSYLDPSESSDGNANVRVCTVYTSIIHGFVQTWVLMARVSSRAHRRLIWHSISMGCSSSCVLLQLLQFSRLVEHVLHCSPFGLFRRTVNWLEWHILDWKMECDKCCCCWCWVRKKRRHPASPKISAPDPASSGRISPKSNYSSNTLYSRSNKGHKSALLSTPMYPPPEPTESMTRISTIRKNTTSATIARNSFNSSALMKTPHSSRYIIKTYFSDIWNFSLLRGVLIGRLVNKSGWK
jgi:hypothetical protein